jgi:hypothetical protein
LVLVRDLYSEPFLLLVLWSGAVLAERWWTRSAGARSDLLSSRWWSDPLRAGAVLLGIWFGTTVVVRAESFLYLAALVPLLTVAGMVRSGATPERWRSNVSWVALGATGPIALGTFDFLFRSGEYVEIIGARVAMSAGLFVVSSVASIGLLLAWKRLKTIRTQFTSAWSSAATVAGAAMSTVVGLLWLVRPLLPPQRVSTELWGVIAEVQRHEGLPIDLHRIYSELSVRQLTWYVGVPVVALGIVGLGLLAARLLRAQLGAAGAVVLVSFATGGFVYLVAPNIVPDQLWATRRMVPVVLPVLVVAAAGAVAWVLKRVDRLAGAAARVAIGSLAAGAFLVPVVLSTTPIALLAEQRGSVAAVQRLCDSLGPDSAVIVVGDIERGLLAPTVRSACGVPAARLASTAGDIRSDVESIESAAEHVEASGGRLALVSFTPGALDAYADAGLGTVRGVPGTTSTRDYQRTLTRAPFRYMSGDERFYLPLTIEFFILDVVAAPS